MRLIDADRLRFSQRYAKADPDSDRLVPVYAIDQPMIDAAPTVDAVPVVRCKDCRYFYQSALHTTCDLADGLAWPGEDDFCSLAQRREQFAGGGKLFSRFADTRKKVGKVGGDPDET